MSNAVVKLPGKNVAANFATIIKNARIVRRLSLRDVENMTGISNAQICFLEGAKTINPRVKTVIMLCGLYGIDYKFALEAIGRDIQKNQD